MSFCHECGSDISQEEPFCPNCGIALRGIAVPEPEKVPEKDDEAEGEWSESAFEAENAEPVIEGPTEQEKADTDAGPALEGAAEDEFVDIRDLKDEGEPEAVATPLAADAETEESQTAATEPEPVARTGGEILPEESSSTVEPVVEAAPAETEQAEEPVVEAAPAETEQAEEPVVEAAPAATEQAEKPVVEAAPAVTEEAEESVVEAAPAATEQAEKPVVEAAPAVTEEAEKPVVEAAPAEMEKAEKPVDSEVPAETATAKPAEDEVPQPEILKSELETPTGPDEAAESEQEAREFSNRKKYDEDFLEDSTLIGVPYPDMEGAGLAAEKPAIGEDVASEKPAPPPDIVAERGADLKTPDIASTPVAGSVAEAEAEEDGVSMTTPNIGAGETAGGKGPKLKPLDEGVVLNGRYEIVRKIGGGGMGAVYLASDKNLGGVLRAVKEMVQSYIEEEQQDKAIQDFKRESMLLTSLDHPSIPTIYDYFFDDRAHRFYLVMKYISGGDLSGRVRSAPEGRLEEKEVAEFAIQIADVLDYLHNRQPPIVYRDLKPANIMLDGNSGKVMLIDFGIARWINKEEKGVTAVGTMGYAPPELFSGNVVPSSDIYSLGSTMFHLLTGADPQNNPLLIFDFQKNPRPRQINPTISDQIEQVVMKAVEYNAEGRFHNAAEMRDALALHLENLNAGTVTYGVSESPKAIPLSDQPVFCGFCGQKIVATDMFCAFCGAKQPLAQPGVHSQEYVPVRRTAKLIIEGTSQLDYPAFELAKDENLVGRRDPMSNIFPEIDLSKFDPQTKISRKHARIWREGEAFMVEDLGSSNGTLLLLATNESVRLVPHKAELLRSGDKIKLGDTTLHFVTG